MIRWHHSFNGHELGQILGDGEGQGSLVCCSAWGHEESGDWTTDFLTKLDSRLTSFQYHNLDFIFSVSQIQGKKHTTSNTKIPNLHP